MLQWQAHAFESLLLKLSPAAKRNIAAVGLDGWS
jgi:hypothetical protein